MKSLAPEQKAGRALEQLLRQEGFIPLGVSYAKSYPEKRNEKEIVEANKKRIAQVVSDYLQTHSAVTSVDIGEAIFLIGRGTPITHKYLSIFGQYTAPSSNRYLREDSRFKHMTLSEAIQREVTIPEGDKIAISSENVGIRPNNNVYYIDEKKLSIYVSERIGEPRVVRTHHISFSTEPIEKAN